MASFERQVRISLHFCAIDLRRRWLDHLTNILGPYLAAGVLTIFFGAILKEYLQGYADYGRHVILGLIVWSYISSTAVEGSGLLSRWPLILRYTDVPILSVAMSVVWRYSIYFLINLSIALTLLHLFLDLSFGWSDAFQLVASVIVLTVLCHSLTILAMLGGGRFRGMSQLLVGIFNIGFLLTPILWKEHFAGRFDFIVRLNPFRHIVEIVRIPASGEGPDAQAWVVAVVVAAATLTLAIRLWRRYEPEVRYWI